MPKGGANSSLALWPSPEEEKVNYIEAATGIAASGVDFLFLEMMKDLEHAPRAIDAAKRCGLPVFLGISARLDGPEKRLVLFGTGAGSENPVPLTADVLASLIKKVGKNIVGVNVMHTNFSAVGPTLAELRKVWQGPVGVYPDHGHFTMPKWEFKEIDDESATRYVNEWVTKYGVGLVGGCCGLGPDFIELVSKVVSTQKRSQTELKMMAAAKRSARGKRAHGDNAGDESTLKIAAKFSQAAAVNDEHFAGKQEGVKAEGGEGE